MRGWPRVLLALGVPLFLMGGCTSVFKMAFDGIRARSGYAELIATIGIILCAIAVMPTIIAMGLRRATFAGGVLLAGVAVLALLLSGMGWLDAWVPMLLVGLIACSSNILEPGDSMRSASLKLAALGLGVILLSLFTESGWRWLTWGNGYNPNSLGTVAIRSGIAIVASGLYLAAIAFRAGAPLASPWQWLASGDWARKGTTAGHLDEVARRHIAELERKSRRDGRNVR